MAPTILARIALFTMLSAIRVLGQEATPALPGHSLHGEVFNEGPRQKAYLMGNTGQLHFPITTSKPEAQKFFDQGVGQLHGFWYFEAERSFRQVLFLDPPCAMAYWGLAMANVNNEKRAKDFIGKAKEHLESAKLTDREKRYLASMHRFYHAEEKEAKKRLRQLVRDYEDIAVSFPEDVEAKAFCAYQIWYNSGRDIPISSHLATQSLINEVYAKNPMHPAHHFQIHLWDGEKPERALASAARCGQAAPGIAHMWHMPGHTYSKEARFHDAIFQQEASARVDHAHMMRDRVLPDQIHNYSHNNGWLVENLGFTGQVDEAISLATNLIELPRIARFQKQGEKEVYDADRSSFREGRNRLWAILRDYEMWDEVLRLTDAGLFAPTDEPTLQAEPHLYRGTAFLWKREFEKAKEEIEALSQLAASLKAEQEALGQAAKKKTETVKSEIKDVQAEVEKARKSHDPGVKAAENYAERLRVHLAVMTERPAEARAKLDKAAGFNPLEKARLHAELAHWEKALELVEKELPRKNNAVIFLANAIDLANKLDRKEEVKKRFEELRVAAASADLQAAPLRRLAGIAKELQLPEDWRKPVVPATDLIARPALDSLGPFRWSPSPAPSWNLAKVDGARSTLEDYRGKNVLVLFYLGKDCTHCMEQLNAFAPLAEAYAKDGVEIVAVSTDTTDGLAKTTRGQEGKEALPFPLLADPEKTAFRAFRAYDEFEEQPLHGAFLLDAQGRIRWQDIGPEPFRHAAWLLGESKRLLRLDHAEQKVAGRN